MHMSDALISPAVGIATLAAGTGIGAYSVKKLGLSDKSVPLMGVMGAFVFAAQMINFTIPATGSSGHIGGGILLAVLLGPYAGFLTLTAVLLIQALFFADGGLLALGCNMLNMGLFACFVAYPLIYKPLLRKGTSIAKLWIASILSVVVALQLGSFGVVLDTLISGKTELPFSLFVVLMQPIHLAIGIFEGIITASVLTFIWKARPALLDPQIMPEKSGIPLKTVLITLLVAVVIIGGGLSWFASSNPDGLEWSIAKTTDSELSSEGSLHGVSAWLQETFSFLPDYDFKNSSPSEETPVNLGTSLSGIVGGGLTLLLVFGIGAVISIFKKKRKTPINED